MAFFIFSILKCGAVMNLLRLRRFSINLNSPDGFCRRKYDDMKSPFSLSQGEMAPLANRVLIDSLQCFHSLFDSFGSGGGADCRGILSNKILYPEMQDNKYLSLVKFSHSC